MDDLERVENLTNILQTEYVIARRDIPLLFDELERTSSQISKYLSGVAELCFGDEAKSVSALTDEKVTQLTERLRQANSKLESHVAKCEGCESTFGQLGSQIRGQLEEVKNVDGLSNEDKELCRQFDVSLSPGEATWVFFAAIPTISLFQILSQFVGLMSSLVGHSHTWDPPSLVGVTSIAASDIAGPIDRITFNYGFALLRAAQATLLTEIGRNPSIPNASADLLQDVFAFKQDLEKLNAQAFLVDGVLAVAQAAVDHAIDDTSIIAKNATGRVRTLLRRFRNEGF